MLSRSLQRVLLDSKWPLPPPFLLPWAAGLTTVSHSMDTPSMPPPPPPSSPNSQTDTISRPLSKLDDTSKPALPSPHSASSNPLELSPSLRELLPLLKAQSSHYITVHIHGKPYLVTQGDTVRLPFLMHGVEPGDVLRLNRAINLGSRDYTLKAGAARPKFKSPTSDTRNVLDSTTGDAASESQVMPVPSAGSETTPEALDVVYAPHFIPHIEKGKHGYLDERLFVCRALVMGVDSEPLRIKEKTKRRQRKVKKVTSKHRFTILKIKELKVRGVAELEQGVDD